MGNRPVVWWSNSTWSLPARLMKKMYVVSMVVSVGSRSVEYSMYVSSVSALRMVWCSTRGGWNVSV